MYVFDHQKNPSLEESPSSSRVVVTRRQIEECKQLLRLMGVPVIDAEGEAEAQCAALCREGKVFAAASEDLDTLAFGSPVLIRNLFTSSTVRPTEIHLAAGKLMIGTKNEKVQAFILRSLSAYRFGVDLGSVHRPLYSPWM